MDELTATGKILIFAGAALLLLGVILVLAGRVPFVGNLPGDLKFEGENYTIYVPITTMLLLSLLLSLILNFVFGGR